MNWTPTFPLPNDGPFEPTPDTSLPWQRPHITGK